MVQTDGLLSGRQWRPDVVLTYGFGAFGDYDLRVTPEASRGFATFTPEMAALAREVFAQVEAFTLLDIAEVAGSAAEVRLARTTDTGVAHAYLPSSLQSSGDVWFNSVELQVENPTPRSYAWMVMFHEIGHSLGLTHPHDGPVVLPTHLDRPEMTVMTYNLRYADYNPQTYMALDIAALQEMYGADYTMAPGDDVYHITPGIMALWDGGGEDTLDFSGLKTDSLHGGFTITLLPGEYSHNAAETIVVGNAFRFRDDSRSDMENAIGTRYADTIRGNEQDNTLKGGRGGDRIWGLEGDDVIRGGRGRDKLHGDEGSDILVGGRGRDTFYVDKNDTVLDLHRNDRVVEIDL